jgi:hypothetical protein
MRKQWLPPLQLHTASEKTQFNRHDIVAHCENGCAHQIIYKLFIYPNCLRSNGKYGLPDATSASPYDPAATSSQFLSQGRFVAHFCIANPPLKRAYGRGIKTVVSAPGESVTLLQCGKSFTHMSAREWRKLNMRRTSVTI